MLRILTSALPSHFARWSKLSVNSEASMPRPGFYYYQNERAKRAILFALLIGASFAFRRAFEKFPMAKIAIFYQQYRGSVIGTVAFVVIVVGIIIFDRRSRKRAPSGYVITRFEMPAQEEAVPTSRHTVAEEPGTSEFIRYNPEVFEKIVGHILSFRGLKIVELGGRRPDGGIDLIAERVGGGAPMGVQVKKYWRERIGVALLREFLGALRDGGYDGGIFVTLKGFSREASDFAIRNNIELWDEKVIQTELDSHRDRWSDDLKALLKTRGLPRCYLCGAEMKLRIARRGRYAGKRFWGCLYRGCKGIVPLE